MGVGLRDVMHHTIFPCTGETSAHYSSLFMGARFFLSGLVPHMGFRFNCVRSPGLEVEFDRVLNPSPLRVPCPGTHAWRGADPNHTQGRETPRGPEVQLLLKYWAGSSGRHLPVALNPLYWVTFPSTLYSHLIKSQVWRFSVQVMIWFGSMKC